MKHSDLNFVLLQQDKLRLWIRKRFLSSKIGKFWNVLPKKDVKIRSWRLLKTE